MTLVTTTQVAARLGLPLPLSAVVEARVTDALEESEDKVLTYLNRQTLTSTNEVVQGLWTDARFPLTDIRAWPQVVGYFSDRYRVASYVVVNAAQETYDVTFKVGLDVAGDPELRPILTFIKADATETLISDPQFCKSAGLSRKVQSVSAEGQSVSYSNPNTGRRTGMPTDPVGSALTLSSLKRWRRLSISQGHSRALMPWPYNDRMW